MSIQSDLYPILRQLSVVADELIEEGFIDVVEDSKDILHNQWKNDILFTLPGVNDNCFYMRKQNISIFTCEVTGLSVLMQKFLKYHDYESNIFAKKTIVSIYFNHDLRKIEVSFSLKINDKIIEFGKDLLSESLYKDFLVNDYNSPDFWENLSHKLLLTQ